MSADATAYVWRFSPFKGATFGVHLAIADSVNDQHEYRCWMTQESLAAKARTSVRTVYDALAALESGGFLKRLGGGQLRGSAIQFRFVFKRHLEAVYKPGRAVDNGSADTSDPPAASSDRSAKTSDVSPQQNPQPDSSGDSLKVVRGQSAEKLKQMRSDFNAGKRSA
jgi:hypothetical protein